jgi:hypothetical protein
MKKAILLAIVFFYFSFSAYAEVTPRVIGPRAKLAEDFFIGNPPYPNVVLTRWGDNGFERMMGGGAILSPEDIARILPGVTAVSSEFTWALTVAHVVVDGPRKRLEEGIRVYIGVVSLQEDLVENPSEAIWVEPLDVYVHSEYEKAVSWEVALLKLPKTDLSKFKPILPWLQSGEELGSNTTFLTLGWGQDETGQLRDKPWQAYLRLAENDCQGLVYSPEQQFCLQALRGEEGTRVSPGDSGSPIFEYFQEDWRVVGLATAHETKGDYRSVITFPSNPEILDWMGRVLSGQEEPGYRPVSLTDAVGGLKILAGATVVEIPLNLDFNGDGRVEMADILWILKVISEGG